MQAIEKLNRQELLDRVRQLSGKGARLVSITGVDTGQWLELIYVFEDELEMVAFKTEVEREGFFPSIDHFYPGAWLAENEIQDLFGLKFEGLGVDFGAYMLLSHDSPKRPFIKEVRVRGAMKSDES
ncbi:MAG TPA: NADH-quinone oxidoreductase subunit C [Syntrophothermus lipocalidus]|uniref:NADH-quinone oxidoreductase subunit C n=1 Tax=Syntrophothermus sp. TaxID=2736299 RepID=UPI00257C0BE5|nr:NADH-quinone oxidoreductase subunit C [Syntrophothermus sp.]NSW82183.1 NADH-quinone oxidoreductase subunit C [Syntrophothermus sp.]HOV43516.1 NADH-quinone oxidoreductase subunit C [Syntrophothermus lipocalidus]